MRCEHLGLTVMQEILLELPQARQHGLGGGTVAGEGVEATHDAIFLTPLFNLHDIEAEREALLDPVSGEQVEAGDADHVSKHFSARRRG